MKLATLIIVLLLTGCQTIPSQTAVGDGALESIGSHAKHASASLAAVPPDATSATADLTAIGKLVTVAKTAMDYLSGQATYWHSLWEDSWFGGKTVHAFWWIVGIGGVLAILTIALDLGASMANPIGRICGMIFTAFVTICTCGLNFLWTHVIQPANDWIAGKLSAWLTPKA